MSKQYDITIRVNCEATECEQLATTLQWFATGLGADGISRLCAKVNKNPKALKTALKFI